MAKTTTKQCATKRSTPRNKVVESASKPLAYAKVTKAPPGMSSK